MLRVNHPLDSLNPEEIIKAAHTVRAHLAEDDVLFRVITLKEPAKKDMIVYLDREHQGDSDLVPPIRIARVQVVRLQSALSRFCELWVDLDHASVVKEEQLEGKHSYVDSNHMKAVEQACHADEQVQAEIRKLELPAGAQVCIEPWTYATDGMNDMSQRITMCWFYLRLTKNSDANYYAYPLDVCAEVSEDLKVANIYRLPSSPDEGIHHNSQPFDRRRVHSSEDSEYHPSLRPPPRTTTRPLHVVQPEGPSFKVDGNVVSWEKWHIRVGFNYREGLTLHDVRYDGRSLFYRLSLAEMFVPYGDPRSPYHRKAAFDLGNDGAGINANNLRLGCDCLGVIKYFDGWHNTNAGEPMKLPNAVCCHEQDDGILWKHTNFRTGNPVVTRSRVLVLQTIITVSNYEYIFAFHFGQDASVHYEVRATGIMSTCPVNIGDSVPYGINVAPGTMAPFHQHLFCLRIDPAIDGHANSLQIEESVPLPVDDAVVHNPYRIGYSTISQIVEKEGAFDLDFTTNKTFKLINEDKLNPTTGTPVGFKLVPHYSQTLLAHPDSYHARRSEFANHAVWLTRHDDEEIFPSGRHTMQSSGGDGIQSGIERRRALADDTSVRRQDVVLWHTFGSTHNPRIEDWPVMPCEKMTVGLKPVNFFNGNPGIDVAVSTQHVNQSVQTF
ncbi:hypothetical protein K431DRAFT_262216 [Polychaeton citri CBS 116435]|uniref:Amine oxidase n=1 Tax=Polychaeton citri CBS 116435 TaxID=1314669 RepID=A0A9P4QEZ7_9PEZI|nr:hypothetical protein K431DRAFT_262216 [Polychaeton citri CBS 116435]